MNTLDILMAVANSNKDLLIEFLRSRNIKVDTAFTLNKLNSLVCSQLNDDKITDIVANVDDIKLLINTAAENGCRGLLTFLLIRTTMDNQVKVAELLIEKGAHKDFKVKCWTLLHIAAAKGYVKVVELLIKSGVDKEAKEDNGRTPLHIAASKGQVDVVKALVEAEANKEAKNNRGWTPLHIAAAEGRVDVVEALVEVGANKEAKNNRGWTPLHIAASKGQVDVVKALVEAEANKEAEDDDGYTPLHTAAEAGQRAAAKLLIEKKANKELHAKFGDTPLHAAAEKGHVKVVELLIEEGAEKEALDYKGRTPLHDAAKEGQVKVVKLLMGKGAEKEAQDDAGLTPLHYAAKEGQVKVVELLIGAGANIDAEDRSHWTPLHYAAEEKRIEVAGLLMKEGANKEARDFDNKTPLHCATGHVEMMKLLIDNEADINALNGDNQNVLELGLQQYSAIKIVSLLCDYKKLLDKGFLTKVQDIIDGDTKALSEKLGFNLPNAETNIEEYNAALLEKLTGDLPHETNIKKFLSAKIKLELLKKLFYLVKTEQVDDCAKPLNLETTKVYEVPQATINKHIVNLEERVVKSTNLEKIVGKGFENTLDFLIPNDLIQLFVVRDHRKRDDLLKKIPNDEMEKATDKTKGDEGTEDNDHRGVSDIYDNLATEICSNVSLSIVGSGGVEECKGQG